MVVCVYRIAFCCVCCIVLFARVCAVLADAFFLCVVVCFDVAVC